MMEFIATNMAPIMFVSLIVFLLIGYPVAFSLAANGLVFFVIGVELAPLSSGNITLDLATALRHARTLLGHPVERDVAGHSLLHLHGDRS